MKLIKQIKIFSIFIVVFKFVSGAQVQILTIEDAIQTALKNNSEIKIALMNVEKAEAAKRYTLHKEITGK